MTTTRAMSDAHDARLDELVGTDQFLPEGVQAGSAEHVRVLCDYLLEIVPDMGFDDRATLLYWRLRTEAQQHGISAELGLSAERELQPVFKAC